MPKYRRDQQKPSVRGETGWCPVQTVTSYLISETTSVTVSLRGSKEMTHGIAQNNNIKKCSMQVD